MMDTEQSMVETPSKSQYIKAPVPTFTNSEESLAQLRELVSEPETCVTKLTHVMHITLPPSFLNKLKTGIDNALQRQMRKYNKELEGIPVGYENVRVLGSRAAMAPGHCLLHLNVLVDLYLFRPQVGSILTGEVVRMVHGYLTCLTAGTFTVHVRMPRPHPHHSLHDKARFRVTVVDQFAPIIYVGGELLRTDSEGVAEDGDPTEATTAYQTSPAPASSRHTRFPTPDSGLGDDAGEQTPRAHEKRRKHGEPDAAPVADGQRAETSRKRKKKRSEEPDVTVVHQLHLPNAEPADTEDAPRKHKKKRKSQEPDVTVVHQELYLPDAEPADIADAPRKHKKKKRKSQEPDVTVVHQELNVTDPGFAGDQTAEALRKHKKKRRSEGPDAVVTRELVTTPGTMDTAMTVDSTRKHRKKRKRESIEDLMNAAGSKLEMYLIDPDDPDPAGRGADTPCVKGRATGDVRSPSTSTARPHHDLSGNFSAERPPPAKRRKRLTDQQLLDAMFADSV